MATKDNVWPAEVCASLIVASMEQNASLVLVGYQDLCTNTYVSIIISKSRNGVAGDYIYYMS